MTISSKVINRVSDLECSFEIRKEIFVTEQGVPLKDEFDEFDNLTSECVHILWIRKVKDYAKIERICVLKNARKYGIGKEIVLKLEQEALAHNWKSALLHGQTHAKDFYKKLGYETSSDEFMEDGIPHILMKKDLL